MSSMVGLAVLSGSAQTNTDSPPSPSVNVNSTVVMTSFMFSTCDESSTSEQANSANSNGMALRRTDVDMLGLLWGRRVTCAHRFHQAATGARIRFCGVFLDQR